MSDITVLQIRETFMLGGGGQAVPAVAVTFKVGEHGPFTELFPKTEYTASASQLKIEAFAAEVRKAAGGY